MTSYDRNNNKESGNKSNKNDKVSDSDSNSDKHNKGGLTHWLMQTTVVPGYDVICP